MDVRNTVMFWCYVDIIVLDCVRSDTVMFWCYVELLCGGKTYSDVLVLC